MAAPRAAPLPPRDLLSRIGNHYEGRSDEWLRNFFDRSGLARRRAIDRALPAEFSYAGKRVLDFGCGAGRVLRHFSEEAGSAEFWGCDLYEPTIDWLNANLSPPFHFYVNDKRPMPHADDYFDLVYAISVFTHITDDWAEWMLELHRILKPGGLLLATFIGPRSWERSLKRPVNADELGMAALRVAQSYADTSGPLVLHSPWWIRGHWGRAFDIVTLRPHGFIWPRRRDETDAEAEARFANANPGHGVFVGRKRPVALSAEDLLRPDPTDEREEAADHQQRLIAESEQPPTAKAPAAGRKRVFGRLRR